MSSNAVNLAPELTWPSDVTDVPTEVFRREDIFEAELEKIFYGPFWHPVAHESMIPNPGDFKTFDLGRVPLLIARGDDGVVRVFINACTHRGNQVETDPCGNRKQFECPYHRWIFGNDGSLKVCPNSDDFSPKFSQDTYGLKEVRHANVHGMILATLSSDAPDCMEWLGRAASTIEKQIGHEGGLKFMGYQKVLYAANWKVYTDNDGYHAPLLHTGFRLLGWQGGAGEQFSTKDGHAGVESQLKPGKTAGVLKDPSLIDFKEANWNSGSFVCGIFPATIVVKHMDIISIRFVVARTVDSTEVHYAYFAKNTDSEEMANHRVRMASNLLGPCGMISMEDAAIFHRVQIGVQASGVVSFQKGIKDLRSLSFDNKQNDEVANIPRWDHYRRIMGFRKAGE